MLPLHLNTNVIFNNHPYGAENVDKVYLNLGPTTITQLQTQVASFRATYNHRIFLPLNYQNTYEIPV